MNQNHSSLNIPTPLVNNTVSTASTTSMARTSMARTSTARTSTTSTANITPSLTNQMLNHELQEFNRLFRQNMADLENYISQRQERQERHRTSVANRTSITTRLHELQTIYGPSPTSTPTPPSSSNATSSLSSHRQSVANRTQYPNHYSHALSNPYQSRISSHRTTQSSNSLSRSDTTRTSLTPLQSLARSPLQTLPHNNNQNPNIPRLPQQPSIDFLHNPRVRDIYRNNRIIVDGRRIVPDRNGNITYQNDAEILSLPGINRPAPIQHVSSETFACPICLDDVSIDFKFTLQCNHNFCKTCLTNTILSALGNVTDEIPIRCPMRTSSQPCDTIITHDLPNIDQLINIQNKEKLERYTLLKMLIDPHNLRYCPNLSCQCPYEFISHDSINNNLSQIPSFINTMICFSCNTSICNVCDSFAHPGISCASAQQRNTSELVENSRYINQHCKRCPNCNCIVQKLKTPEQEEYERATGMQGGTQECHHMTCSSCKRDFCWICMQNYNQTRYYHPECPTSDCNIRFVGSWPHIIGLPIGIYRFVDVMIQNSSNITRLFRQYDLMNQNPLLGSPALKNNDNTVTITCQDNGIVTKMTARGHELTFKQENKANL